VDSSVCSGTKASKSLSGYFSVTGSEYDTDDSKNYFFWMHESQETPTDDTPFVIWLTGGPGRSSTLALLTENGPCSVNPAGDGTVPNPYSWNTAANVLWLDQPAGVGFSYGTENDGTEEMVGEDAYYFIQNFMKAHPEYAKNPLYVFGESYGGHYAPAIAHRVFEGNKAIKDGDIAINLAGVGVGNGLTAPEIQYQYYAEMAYNNSHGIQTVSESTYNSMVKATPACIDKIKKCNDSGGFSCTLAYTSCNSALTTPYYSTGLNPYDISKECGDNPLCYDFSNTENWLTSQSTRDALNVVDDSASWVSCNNAVNAQFKKDWMVNFDGLVGDMLEGGIDVLIYAGDLDFICNSIGNYHWTLQLDWTGKESFNSQEDKDWNGMGSVRSSNGLTFLTVYDGGHMVPADQPEAALKMLNTFINKEAF
jgi:cathepsin A (carboxypeptidase C)